MADAVTVRHGDTLTKILKKKRGVNPHEIFRWQRKIAPMNPHISDLDRLFPGESILIPNTFSENVLRHWIWQNAFSKLPHELKQPYDGSTMIYFVHPGDTIDTVAQHIFADTRYYTMPASNKRALLIHNNPYLENHLDNGQLPLEMMLNITPAVLKEFDQNHWQREQSHLKSYLEQMHQDTRDMFTQIGPEPTTDIAQLVAYLQAMGASVGLDDVVKTTSYGIAGVSGHAAAGSMALANVNALARDLYNEAIGKFGYKNVHSKSTNHLKRIQSYLSANPKYAQLMRQLRELPKHLLPKGASLVPTNTHSQVSAARHFRKQFALPMKKWNNSTKHVSSVAKRLNGRLSIFKSIGRHATWYIPATLGVISVATAPPELRMRTLFEEGFGLVGGALGTMFGSSVVGAGALGLLALCGVCLGPFGAFVVVFICASAGGIAGMELFKKFGSGLYDYGEMIYDNRIYHSPVQLLGGSL